jgi:hypothetical protein
LAIEISLMSWFERDKERQRYYLLPGMGGRALRRKHRRILGWSIAFGLVISAILTFLLYFMGSQR